MARVVGRVVSTVKDPALHGLKILVVQPLDERGKDKGATLLALDHVDAGEGETVLLLDEGGSAGIVLGMDDPPIRTVVVGIVDSWDVDGPRARKRAS